VNPTFTKQHYEAIAGFIREARDEVAVDGRT